MSCGRRALEETVEAFRGELVRRFGEPWYLDREALVGRLPLQPSPLICQLRDQAAAQVRVGGTRRDCPRGWRRGSRRSTRNGRPRAASLMDL